MCVCSKKTTYTIATIYTFLFKKNDLFAYNQSSLPKTLGCQPKLNVNNFNETQNSSFITRNQKLDSVNMKSNHIYEI